MTHEARNRRQLIEIWLAANEGQASEAEIARLNEAIVVDNQFREDLVLLVEHQSWVQWNGMNEACAVPSVREVVAASSSAVPSTKDEQPERFTLTPGVRRASVKSGAFLLGVFALGACLAGLAVWGVTLTNPQLAGETLADATIHSPQMRLVSGTQCLWGSCSASELPVLGQQLEGGQSLHLLEGIAEVSVASDMLEARLHLEGPVALMLTEQGMPILRYGKMTAKVDGFSHDEFVVETPFGRVMADGGSEVGISALGSAADVHAFDGRVTVESPWLVTADELQGTAIVNSGEALRIENIGGGAVDVVHTASNRDYFLPEVSMDSDHLVVGPEYIRAVRRSAPVAYWRFEGAQDGLIQNEMQDRFHGEIQRTVEWSGPRGNQAIQLGMSDNPGSMVVTGDWDEVLAGDFAIEAWIKPSHFHRGSVIGFVGEFDWKVKKNTHGILLEVCGIPHYVKSRSIRFLHRAPATISGVGGVNCYSDVGYIPRRWQHVVAQRDGQQMQLFLNGELVQEEYEALPTPSGLKLVMGQLYSEAVERFFTGQVDEVAIYDRALGQSDIQKHFEILRPAVKSLQGI